LNLLYTYLNLFMKKYLSSFIIVIGLVLLSVGSIAQVVIQNITYSHSPQPYTVTASGIVPPCGSSTGTLTVNMTASSLPAGTSYTIQAQSSLGYNQINVQTTVTANQLITQSYSGLAGSVSGVFYTITIKTPKIPPAFHDSTYIAVINIKVFSTKTFQAQVTPTNPKCPVPPNKGNAVVSVLSGTAPYTYTWSNIAPNPGNVTTANNLDTSSFYSVYVKDANGCDTTMPFNISIINPTVALTSNPSSPICDPVLPVNIVWTATPAPGWALNVGGSFSWNGGLTWTSSTTSPIQTANVYGIYTQSVIFRDANDCRANNTLPVPVDKRPVFTASANPTSVCPGLTSVVTANLTTCSGISGASCSYSFDGGATYLSPNSNVYTTPAINKDTTIIVRVTNSSGCFRNANVSIDTLGKPKLQIVVPTVCPNAAYIITSTCTANCGSIQMNFNSNGYIAGSPQSYTQPIAPLVPTTTSYTLSAKGGNGCQLDTMVTVNVFNNTLAITKPADTTVCANNTGSTVSLTATGFFPASTITWSTNPAGMPGDGSHATTILASSPAAGPIIYTVTGTDTHGCVPRTTSQSIVADPKPVVSVSGPVVHCEGTTSTLLASGATTYSWYNVSYSTLLSSPGSAYAVSPLVATTYNVIGTDANGCIDSTTYVLPFQNRPTGTASLLPSTICSGNTTTVTLNPNAPFTPNAGGGYSITDGSNYSNSATFAGAGPFSNTTVINTKLKDNFGCISLTIPVTLTVTPFTYQAVATNPLCSNSPGGGSILIKNLSGGTSPNANYSVDLSSAVPFTSNVTISNLASRPSQPYLIHITDNSTPACSHDTNITIATPLPLVFDTLSSNDVICNGDANGSIPVQVTGGTSKFTYYLNTTSGAPAIPLTTNTNPTYTGLGAGVYNVIVVDAKGCTDTVTNVPINQPAVITGPSASTVSACYGTTNGSLSIHTVATGGWGGFKYSINTTPVQSTLSAPATFTNLGPGNYVLTVLDSKGCSFNAGSYNVASFPQIILVNAVEVPANCNNPTGSLTINGATGGVPPYVFTVNGSPYTVGTPITALGPGSIETVHIVCSAGCQQDSVFDVRNSARSMPIMRIIPSTCPGSNNARLIVDSVRAKSPSVPPYKFDFFENTSPLVTVGSFTLPNANTQDSIVGLTQGSYVMNISDNDTPPCLNYPVDSFVLNSAPGVFTVVKASFNPLQINAGYAKAVVTDPAGFTTSSIALASDISKNTGSVILYNLKGGTPFPAAGGQKQYQMSIDNPLGLVNTVLKDTLGNQTYVSYSNLSSGLHTIFIRDQNGCSDSINVEVPGKFFIPNLVSPNGDTHNDVFEIVSLPDNSELKISNRWGERIYESSNYNNQYNFEGLSDGVYYYDLKFNTGARFKGWVQVLR
jgi:gliding motility-associated-like protein